MLQRERLLLACAGDLGLTPAARHLLQLSCSSRALDTPQHAAAIRPKLLALALLGGSLLSALALCQWGGSGSSLSQADLTPSATRFVLLLGPLAVLLLAGLDRLASVELARRRKLLAHELENGVLRLALEPEAAGRIPALAPAATLSRRHPGAEYSCVTRLRQLERCYRTCALGALGRTAYPPLWQPAAAALLITAALAGRAGNLSAACLAAATAAAAVWTDRSLWLLALRAALAQVLSPLPPAADDAAE